MQSRWKDADARRAISVYGALGAGEGLALRTYTTRLLGREPALVLHGGGNTSLKTEMEDLAGETHEVLCVKGSGWDMGAIDPSGFAAVKLGAAAQAARARRSERRGHGARPARLSARSAGAGPVGGVPAARLHAAQIRRPHARQRRPRPDRPAQRRGAGARGLRRPPRARALPPPGLRPRARRPREVLRRQARGRGPDPRQARHLHLRRDARARPTSA